MPNKTQYNQYRNEYNNLQIHSLQLKSLLHSFLQIQQTLILKLLPLLVISAEVVVQQLHQHIGVFERYRR